jgi:hypothetical protein
MMAGSLSSRAARARRACRALACGLLRWELLHDGRVIGAAEANPATRPRLLLAKDPGPVAAGVIYSGRNVEEATMSLGTILLIVLILILVGALPTWPHSAGWGYYPAGGLGLVLVIVLILVLLGRI